MKGNLGPLFLAIFTIIMLACSPSRGEIDNREQNTMSVQIQINTPKSPYIAGGQMPLDVVVLNVCDKDIMMAPPHQVSPFTYIIESKDGQYKQVAGEGKRDAMLLGGVAPLEDNTVTVPPNASLSYKEDLSQSLTDPLPPGEYSIKAVVRADSKGVTSKAFLFTVQASAFSAMAHSPAFSGGELFSIMFRQNDKHIITRVSPFQGNVDLGTSVTQKFSTEVNISNLVAARETNGNTDWRWVAWLNANHLEGIMVEQYDTSYPFTGVNLGLTDAEIISGFQDEKGLATFVIIGIVDGKRVVKLAKIVGVNKIDVIDTGLILPINGQVTASHSSTTTEPTIVIHWAETAGKETLLKSVSLASPKDVHLHLKTIDKVLAWTTPALIKNTQSVGFVILEQNALNQNHSRRLVTVDFSGIKKNTEISIPKIKEPVSRWLLPDQSSNNMALLALVGHDVKIFELEGDAEWASLTTIDSDADDLTYLTVGTGTWFSWHSPASGLVFAKLKPIVETSGAEEVRP